MRHTDPLENLASRIAETYAREPRPEAAMTARIILASNLDPLRQLATPCDLDQPIRSLLQVSSEPLAAAILAAQPHLPWGSNPVAVQMGDGYASLCAVATLLGPDGPLLSHNYRLGLFYQRSDCYYPLHSHLADETYVILAGRALWTAGPDRRPRGPGDMIHHPSLMPHAFRTGPEGLLALWRWSGDIGADSYQMLSDPEEATA